MLFLLLLILLSSSFAWYAYGALIGVGTLFLLIGILFHAFNEKQNLNATVAVRGPREGESAIYRQRGREDEAGGLLTRPFPEVSTLYEGFQHGLRIAGDLPCMGRRDSTSEAFKYRTYKQVNEKILNFGSGLALLPGLREGDRMGFYSRNCVQWSIAAGATYAYNFVSVSLYDTLGPEHRPYIISQSKIKVILCESKLVENLFDAKKKCPDLEYIIVIDEDFYESDKVDLEEMKRRAELVGITLHSFSEVEQLGSDTPIPVRPASPDDLCIIMYTSGTTSRPKGVMITHKQIVAVTAAAHAGGQAMPFIAGKTVYLSYLPAAHIFERAVQETMYATGSRVAFSCGDIRQLSKDIEDSGPTLFAGVPKVFSRMCNKISEKVSASLVSKSIFWSAYYMKRWAYRRGLPTPILDIVVFNKLKKIFGGRLRQIISGSAPFSPETHEMTSVCFGVPVMQGYGMTESGGGCAVTYTREQPKPYGVCGAPFCCTEIKLIDAGKYKTTDKPFPRGEVLIGGANVTNGYLEMPEKTKADFITDEEGRRWFKSGDVGQINADGTLSIVGRTKDIFKLDNGEYVSPDILETAYLTCPLVGCVFVYGETTKSNVVAIVVPDSVGARNWAKENGVSIPDDVSDPDVPPSLCENEAFQSHLHSAMIKAAKAAGVTKFGLVASIHLSPTFWTASTNLVTAALKNKRPVLADHFREPLAEMYRSIGQ